jgi:dihydrofolate synthase/folylpolyglutamate synthase
MSRATIAQPKRASKKKKPAGKQVRTYRSAVRYLDSLTNNERISRARYTASNFSLARTTRLLGALHKPQDDFRSVHIAGTKGKGSTATMVAAMLHACGIKVGLYTSPHVLDIRERIAIDGRMISENAFAKAVASVSQIVEKARVSNPTYFEVLTAAAFKHFSDNDVELAVVETGLGGRLDATNVLTPDVVGLTSMSIDHTAQLGNDIASITREKAAIMKTGVPVISAPQDPKVASLLRELAAEAESPLRFSNENVDFSYRFEFSRSAGRHARICMTTPTSRFEHLKVPLYGAHQAANCCLALNIIDQLKNHGFPIDDVAAKQGLSEVRLLGRMDMINENPRILVDGAHNAASIDALMRAVGQHIPYDSMIVIFGCQKDKDIPGMMNRLRVGADKVIFVSSGSIRSADPHELSAHYNEISGKMSQVAGSLEDAITIATSAITSEDLICITGSFYLVAEAMRKFSQNPL